MPPVDDHPVHELVKIAIDKPYGCKDHVTAKGYYAPDRVYRPDGAYWLRLTFIPHRLTTSCKYDLRRVDPRCTGCKWESDGC
jgi:hypothetical protein